tara:strand:- start:93 stop:254 length:162 start_codon:yes stop_codon:yes gene_type:complete
VGHTRSRCPDRRAITQSVIAALEVEQARLEVERAVFAAELQVVEDLEDDLIDL